MGRMHFYSFLMVDLNSAWKVDLKTYYIIKLSNQFTYCTQHHCQVTLSSLGTIISEAWHVVERRTLCQCMGRTQLCMHFWWWNQILHKPLAQKTYCIIQLSDQFTCSFAGYPNTSEAWYEAKELLLVYGKDLFLPIFDGEFILCIKSWHMYQIET